MADEIKKQEGKHILGSRESVVFLIDASGSMSDDMSTDTDSYRNRKSKMDVLKGALHEMLLQRVESQGPDGLDQVSIVSFASSGRSTTHEVLKLKVPVMADLDCIQSLHAAGGTPMLEALRKAVEILDRSAEGLARIVMFTDGKPDGGGSNTEEIKQLVPRASDEYGIVVDTVGIGKKDDAGYSFDGELLRELSLLGHGDFYDLSEGSEAIALLKNMESERRALVGHGVFLLSAGT